MRLAWTWLRSHRLLALVALAIAVSVLVFSFWPRERITQANFQKIQVGMSQAGLRELLGEPEYEAVEFGLVQGPGNLCTQL
jgi:hypothetical protein